jgi:hypothetical protein
MVEHQSCRVLVVVAGSNADVVGTTLEAFVARDRRRVDELHVLASIRTGDSLRAQLVRPPGGGDPVGDVCRRLGIVRSDILFGARTIHLLGDPDEHAAFGSVADDALEVLRSLCTGSNEIALVAAPDAGATSVLAYAALQFIGRPFDRFFFLDDGTSSAVPKSAPAGRRIAAKGPLGLLELPTVLAVRPLDRGETFQHLAESRRLARQRLSQPGSLILNGPRRTVRIDDTEFSLPRLQFFWLFALAALAPGALPLKTLTDAFHVDAHGRVVVAAPQPERATLEAIIASVKKVFITLFPDAADEFAQIFKRACGPLPGLPSIVAKINARLKNTLGIGATPYLIAGGRSAEGYRLTLPPASIRTEPHLPGAQSRHHSS